MNTNSLYLLGHPIGHSKSPAMHNAAYRALGLDWCYGLADRETEADAWEFIVARDWLALNVTMPWKCLAIQSTSQLSQAARAALGANVLINWDGTIYADNTDGTGCVTYLRRCGVAFEGARVVVCGTGPTALAIMHACADAGAGHIALMGRNATRCAEALASYQDRLQGWPAGEADSWKVDSWEAGSREALVGETGFQGVGLREEGSLGAGFCETGSQGTDFCGIADHGATSREELVHGAPFHEVFSQETEFDSCAYGDAELREFLSEAQIIIDATPLGMNAGDPAPFDTSLLVAGQTVLDVVYGHGTSRLVSDARTAGCVAYDGRGMLVAQAVETVVDIARITGAFNIPSDLDLFSIMAEAAR